MGMRLRKEVGRTREGSSKNWVSDFGVPNEHKAEERVLRGRLEGRN